MCALVLSCLVLCDSGRMFRVSLSGVVSRCVSVVSWLLASVSSLVFSCTCVCRLCRLSVLSSFLGLCFVFTHFLVSIVGFCVLFRVPCAPVFICFCAISPLCFFVCRCVQSFVYWLVSRGSCLVVRVPWFLGSVFLCPAVAPYVVYLFVCILCCEETDDDQVPS